MNHGEPQDYSRREWLAVAVVAMVGAGLRLWPVGRLGLTHFDEGIYALAASWSLQPKGLATLDPSLIPYAPPGYPILGGLAYAILGRSDGAMIAVSQLAGILTIPVVAWLARRTFGPGAGFAAAVCCAFSGPHVAFSRMALTDASFLLAWLLAVGSGMRFLERPGLLRAVVLGLAVGLAQQFKYNGWLTGGIVIFAALIGIVVRPEERKPVSILKTFGGGAFGAFVAWLVVWPWYSFVEGHGGYSALLRHQRSYLGGFRNWEPNLLIQADQAVALSGGTWLIAPGLVLAGLTLWIDGPAFREARSGAGWFDRFRFPAILSLIPAWYFLASPYWLGLVAAPWLLSRAQPSFRVVGIWWLTLTATSPFYHPYARLWLPLHAVNWMLLGWLISDGFATIRGLDFSKADRVQAVRRRSIVAVSVVLLSLGWLVHFTTTRVRHARAQPDLLAPSDSLYQATVQVASKLPDEVKGLQLLVRPPVTYYLAGRVALFPMAGSDSLLRTGDPRVWALVDSAILRSEAASTSGRSGRNLLDRFANHWELVEEFPTNLSLPTMLDLDPGAARTKSSGRSSPLWLLRPRRPGASR